MNCPKCNETNKSGSRFCKKCGAKLPEELKKGTGFSFGPVIKGVVDQTHEPFSFGEKQIGSGVLSDQDNPSLR